MLGLTHISICFEELSKRREEMFWILKSAKCFVRYNIFLDLMRRYEGAKNRK